MKKTIKSIIITTLIATMVTPALAVPVGNDVEYIPPTRNLGVGVVNPAAKLEVNGQVMITGGNPQEGYVLTSDALGLASWSELSIQGSSINGAVASAIAATKLSSPDGSPDPAFTVDNDGNLISAGGDIQVPNDTLIGRGTAFPRAISWDNQGTLIRDTGHVDFIADDNNDNSGVGFKFFVNSPDRATAKLVAQFSDQGTVAATKFVGDGSMLTGITAANVANADTANIADFATSADTSTSATSATNASNMVNGSIISPEVTAGIINGSTLVNVNFDDINLNPYYTWKLVHVEDFNSTASNWSNNTVTACGPHNILGGYNVAGAGTELIKIFNLSGIPHTHVKVKFNFFSIDSYDNEYGILELDGEHVWSQKFYHAQNSRSHICGSSSWHDTIVTGEAIKEHTGNTLQVEFESTLNQAANDESFGVDNLEVWVRIPLAPVPQLPYIAQPPPPPPPPPKPKPPAYSHWYYAPAKECRSYCASIGKTNVPDPNGFYCASGESRSKTSLEAYYMKRISFPYGCWSDRSCWTVTGGYISTSWGNFCYRNNQKADYDWTDITVACYCK